MQFDSKSHCAQPKSCSLKLPSHHVRSFDCQKMRALPPTNPIPDWNSSKIIPEIRISLLISSLKLLTGCPDNTICVPPWFCVNSSFLEWDPCCIFIVLHFPHSFHSTTLCHVSFSSLPQKKQLSVLFLLLSASALASIIYLRAWMSRLSGSIPAEMETAPWAPMQTPP